MKYWLITINLMFLQFWTIFSTLILNHFLINDTFIVSIFYIYSDFILMPCWYLWIIIFSLLNLLSKSCLVCIKKTSNSYNLLLKITFDGYENLTYMSNNIIIAGDVYFVFLVKDWINWLSYKLVMVASMYSRVLARTKLF